MAMVAAERLGATPVQLETLYLLHTPHLEPVDSPSPDVSTHKRADNYSAAIAVFHAMLEKQGVNKTLAAVLPDMLPGISTSSFHAVIRLAYAVETDNADELSHALAFWHSQNVALGSFKTVEGLTAEAHLNKATGLFRVQQYKPGIIADHIEELVTLPQYRQIADVPASLDLEKIIAIVATRFNHSNDFTLLHGLTALHALIALKPHIEDFDTALHYYWQAYVAASCTAEYREHLNGCDLETLHPNNKPDWPGWFEKALETGDDHTIKVVYSCSRLYRIFKLPILLATIEQRLEKRQ